MKTTPNPLDSLEAQLRHAPPAAVPTDLHDAIVSAVRSARAESARLPAARRQPWLALTLVTVLAGAGLWWAVRPRPAVPGALPEVAVVGELRETARVVASNVPNPLAEELESVSRDFNRAVSFVAARVPVGL